jgi:glycosyltransferase involved in cell wall biosynthesis/peptidoglycan/xylan/chitin deacetylase (PgdA/CDA1 family)
MRHRLYYRIKPLVPGRIRVAIRGWLTRRMREQFREVWPILPGSERRPKDWPGWPGGKKFAFVLTHDVEGQSGVDKCRQLMEVEKKYGFRSSFNFIPEGSYWVPDELRKEIVREGFEVGVHDLHHDGRLYDSRKQFARNAARINHYVKEWGAAGFRSGFMFHNLEWLHDLDIQYDASTFDTDPFEPQPGAGGTIFPFWREGVFGEGYVELPYTLPQDSTLFLLLRERTPAIWRQKTDWLAEKGGMVLLTVHPDYVAFPGESPRSLTFPVSLYEQFLEFICEKYGQAAWNCLAREMADWYKETCVIRGKPPMPGRTVPALGAAPTAVSTTRRARKPRRAAVILYSYYANDPRPRREAEALVRLGMEVDVLCLREAPGMGWREKLDGVNVFHAPLRRRRASKATYILQYGGFFFYSMFFWSARSLWVRYDVVHVHNMPDFLVFSAVAPWLLGAKIILDLHDPMPELFQGIYGWSEKTFAVRLLKWVEKASIAAADLVLTPNIAFQELFSSRGAPPGKIKIVMNSPREDIFDSSKFPSGGQSAGPWRPFLLMYHGLLVERHGLDLALKAVAQLHPRIPGLTLRFYGENTEYMEMILGQIRELGMEKVVQYGGFKNQREIAQIISTIDLGLIPNRRNQFTSINFPTRIFEYLAMNKPVLMTRTKGVQDYFAEDEILYFGVENPEELAQKIEWAYEHPAELRGLVEKGRKVFEKHRWLSEEARFGRLVNNTIDNYQ